MPSATNQHLPSYNAASQDAASARVSQHRCQILRECVQVLISVPIVGLALYLLADAYFAVKSGPKAYADLKDVLAPAPGDRDRLLFWTRARGAPCGYCSRC